MPNNESVFIVCNTITDKVVKDSTGCGGVVFLKDPEGLKSKIKCPLINAYESDRAAMKWMFDKNKERLTEWKKYAPDVFICEGIDLLESINKDYFWARRDENTLIYASRFMIPADAILKYESRNEDVLTAVKQRLRLLLFCRPSDRVEESGTVIRKKFRYGFYVRHADQVDYFSRLIEECGKENCVLISNYIWPAHVGRLNYTDVFAAPERLKALHSRVKFSAIRSGLKYFTASELITILKVREKLISNYYANRSLWNAYGIKAVFLAAQEVEGFGNLTSMQGNQLRVVTINSHNGTKSGDVYNRDNYFSAWCVWDEQMKSLLNKDCGIARETMRITGHLRSDLVAGYKYSGSLNSFFTFPSGSDNGIVISYFSTYADIPLRFEVAEALVKFVEGYPNARLLIRLHRKENRGDWNHLNIISNEKIFIMHPDDDSGNNRLYDMFSVSDLTVCQGSTVAIESNWFGVDAVTVENRDRSIIYCAGSEHLIHVRDVESMLNAIRQKLANRRNRHTSSLETGVMVSRKIRDIAEELICNNEK